MVLPCVNRSLVGISLYKSFHRLPAILGGVLILAAALFPPANIASAQGNAGTCSTGGAVADVANNPGLVSDCEALLAARDTLAGSATLNWSADKRMTEWEGVIFAGSPPGVIALDLSARGLTGELPTELGRLNNLLRISLWGNSISGTVPTSLSGLLKLEVLDLGDNRLTGSIPPELGNLTYLRELRLNQSELTGEIPVELGYLLDLEILWLQEIRLTGEIPAELGNLTNLRELFLLRNRLTGDIPPELGKLTRIEILALWENELSGSIPSSLGNLVNVTELNLGDNQLSGSIYSGLGNLVNLEWLDLSKNRLTGEILQELSSLTNLGRLYVSQNQLSGCIPGGMRNVVDNDLRHMVLPFCDVLLSGLNIRPGPLVPAFDPYHRDYSVDAGMSRVTVVPVSDHNSSILFLDQNGDELADADDAMPGHQVQFSPELPAIRLRVVSQDEQANFSYTIFGLRCFAGGDAADAGHNPGLVSDCNTLLEASKDVFAGMRSLNWSERTPISEWEGVTLAGSPPRVTELDLSAKSLTGHIPPEFGNLTNLQSLNLHENRLSGEIPPELGRLSNLLKLQLSENNLTGPVPAELGVLVKLQELLLHRNQLNGPIPAELQRLTNLEVLQLWRNELTGPIPAWLGDLSNLRELILQNNDLQGDIPDTLGALSQLEHLSLGGSKLTGTIPASLGNLGELHTLFLYEGELTGPIPTELGRLTKLTWLNLSENLLTGEIPVELGSLPNLELVDLNGNRLRGGIPSSLGELANLKWLYLSGNELMGEIPEDLDSLHRLQRLHVSENRLIGCVPVDLRDVEDNDLDELRLPSCDGLLRGLTTSQGWLVPSFDRYHTDYTVAVGRSRLTVFHVIYPDASSLFLDENDLSVADADYSVPGHQVDFSAALRAIRIRVISKDGQSTYTYTVTDLGIRYDTDENGVIDGSETRAAIADYFAGRIVKEEVIGIVRLNFVAAIQRLLANNPLLPFRGVPASN